MTDKPSQYDAVTLASELMRCESVTPHEAGALTTLQNMLEPLGFTVHREIFREEGTEPVENMYAQRGEGKPNLCFAGHVDVVPPGRLEKWDTPPFEPTIKDGVLYGRGAEDMKGAIGAFVAATKRFVDAYPQHDGAISYLITCDEEGVAINGTRKMLGWMQENNHQIDACIVGEPTNPTFMGEMAKIGRRGSVTFHLEVRGKQGHIAYPDNADNPITRMVYILQALKSHKLDHGTEFFPPSNLEITTIDVNNPTVNLIPGDVSAAFNVRFNNLHTSEQIVSWVREACEQYADDFELKHHVTGEAFLTNDEQLKSVVANAIEKVTGHVPDMSTTGGTSDARYIKDVCPVVEFGTTGHTPHQLNERVSVEALEQLADVYYAIICGYFGVSEG